MVRKTDASVNRPRLAALPSGATVHTPAVKPAGGAVVGKDATPAAYEKTRTDKKSTRQEVTPRAEQQSLKSLRFAAVEERRTGQTTPLKQAHAVATGITPVADPNLPDGFLAVQKFSIAVK